MGLRSEPTNPPAYPRRTCCLACAFLTVITLLALTYGFSSIEFPYVEVMAPKLKAALRIRTVRPSRAHVGSIPEGIQWTAQSLEDEHAWNTYFYGLHGGVILESGAADGRLYSTTLAFDKLDWTSVHIEASPISFRQLIDNRPNSVNIHAALCDTRRTVHLVDAPIGNVDVAAGILEFMTPDFVEHFHPTLARDPAKVEQLPVIECLPLVPLLQEHGNFSQLQVDFWVLDTEGSELAVLRTVNWDEVRPGTWYHSTVSGRTRLASHPCDSHADNN